MYGPAVRCKRFRRSGVSGLASMYPVSDWNSLCAGPSWISARMRSHYRTGLIGPFGSPVFACAGKTDPPSLLILSQTSAGEGVWRHHVIACPFNALSDQANWAAASLKLLASKPRDWRAAGVRSLIANDCAYSVGAGVSERPSARAPNESARGQAPRRGWSKMRRGSDRGSKTAVCLPSIYYLEETRNEQIAHPCPASPVGRRYHHPRSGGGCHGGGIDAGGDRAGAAI